MTNASTRKVVVTGLGVISGVGTGADAFFNNLIAGKSGISRLTRFDPTDFRSQIGSEARDFDPTLYMDKKEANRNDRYVQFAICATHIAMKDAGLTKETIDAERTGVYLGTGVGGMESIEKHSKTLYEKGPSRMSPFTITNIIANMASGCVGIEIGAKGPNYTVISACASGAHAIGEALLAIQQGRADMMICGGTEAALTPLSYGGFCAMKAMSSQYNDQPERASRPFEKNRDGFVMGEGAGVLVIESEASAKARGAKIYCELAGYGATCDAYHMTSPDIEGRGLSMSMQKAFEMAGVPLDKCDYINAHGTSTSLNDKFETLAIKKTFGAHAYKLLMSSTKSMTGHLLGAAGGIEAIVAIKTIETGKVPPTINYEEPDPDCDLNYVPNKMVEFPVKVSASNNLGFGGHNASLVFKAVGV